MQLYSTLSFIQNIFSISYWPNLDSLEPVPQSGKRAKNKVKKEKAVAWRGKWQGRDAADPRDMPLMLPFCDTILVSNVFMLTDSRCCGQYRTLSIEGSYNLRKDFKRWTRVDWWHQRISPGSTFSPPQTTSWPALLRFSEDPLYTACNQQFFWYHGTSLWRGSIKILQTS